MIYFEFPNPTLTTDHESTAVDQYLVKVKEDHHGFQITKAGLFIDPDRPYIAATPDGIIQCDCGKGALEVKCPYNYKDSLPNNDETNCCMDGNWTMHIITKFNYSYTSVDFHLVTLYCGRKMVCLHLH